MAVSLIIAVTSGKGGVGKSTVSVGLSIAAALGGKSVLLMDMDAGMRCLDTLLSVSEKTVFDLSDAIGGRPVESCILTIPSYPGLSLLPAPDHAGGISPEAFGDLIRSVSDKYDVIVLDFPAGADVSLFPCLPRETQFLCVCNPDPVCVRDASLVASNLRKLGRTARLVINKYRYYCIKNSAFSDLDDIIDTTCMKLTGIVPLSERLEYAFYTGRFPKKGREYKAFNRIWGRLSGKNIALPKLNKI